MASKETEIAWGLDLGGTKIEIALFSYNRPFDDLKILYRKRVKTESSSGYSHIIRRIKDLCEIAEADVGRKIMRFGIGHPGCIDRKSHLIKNSNTTCLNGMPFGKDLTLVLKEIGIQSINFENDANCFALAEASFGAGRLSKSSFGVILGTGVGGGLIVNDRILRGIDGIAGEWGHLSVWDEGPKCYCGKGGCIETIISGPALEELYFNMTGIKRTFSEISERVQGEVAARRTLDRLYYWLGKGLSHVVNLVNPECIILGGGLSNIEGLYVNNNVKIAPWVFNKGAEISILKAQLGDSAGVLGAGLISKEDFSF